MRKTRLVITRLLLLFLPLFVCCWAINSYAQHFPLKPRLAIVHETSKKPIIGISAGVNEAIAGVTVTYVNSVRKAGGLPLIIPFTSCEEELAQLLCVVDGVVVTGGEDIAPTYYGEEPIRALGKVAPARDEFDYKLIRMAVEKGLPLLGICRGEQMLNVAFGGTLYQDIVSQQEGCFIKHNQEAPRTYATHSIQLDKSSLLYHQLGSETVYVNSYHHQAVKDVAPGFKVTARSADGVVEAIEMVGSDKVWGVQFHPEGLVDGGDSSFLAIFSYLIDKAAER